MSLEAGPASASAAAGKAPALVELVGVSCSYGGPAVLSDVDLRIEQGALVGVVGPSGAGKTTLLRAIVGAVPKMRGEVRVGGQGGHGCHVSWTGKSAKVAVPCPPSASIKISMSFLSMPM